MRKITTTLLLLFAILMACSKNEVREVEDYKEDILARVGDRTISVTEFKTRAEFTIRPAIYKDKNITLNNLISEKLLAMEAGPESEVLQNPNFKARIKGLIEQKMRERLYYQEGLQKATIDTNELKTRFRLSQREYDLSFFSIRKDEIGQELKTRIENAPDSLEAIFEGLNKRGKIGTQSVKWKDPEHDSIHEALFSAPVKQHSIIGPLQLAEDDWIFMRVDNWRDTPIIGPEQAQMRVAEIKEKVGFIKGNAIYRNFISQVMKGKKIDFDRDTFSEVFELVYAKEQERRKEQEPNVPQDTTKNEEVPIDDIQEIDKMLNKPFFTIDDEVWTIGDFKALLMSHPLKYRRQPNSKNDFVDQFRYAIADLIRDHYLNKEAYKRGLDKHPLVQRTKEMWTDAYNAIYQRDKIMAKSPKGGDNFYERNKIKSTYWDTYIDSLHNTYSEKISVDSTKFSKIKLTKIDMFVTQNGVPYPIPVPSFPQISVSKDLSYAKNRKEEDVNTDKPVFENIIKK